MGDDVVTQQQLRASQMRTERVNNQNYLLSDPDVINTAESEFLNLKFEYLNEILTKIVNILTCCSNAKKGT